jgi:hypothetical protein
LLMAGANRSGSLETVLPQRNDVAAIQRAALAHDRAAKTHETASKLHSDASKLFARRERPESADRERKLASAHAKAAANQRRLAKSDCADAQKCADG